MSAEDITNQTYNHIAASYADRYWQSTLGETLSQFVSQIKSGGRVLDAGCGPGRDVQQFNLRGLNAFGLDRSIGMLNQAQRRVGYAFVCADMRRLPFAHASFDGIWMCASLLHIPRGDVPTVLNEARRILRPQGVMYLSVRQGEGEEWSESDGGPRLFTLFQVDELLSLLKQARFTVQNHVVETFGHSTWISIHSLRDG